MDNDLISVLMGIYNCETTLKQAVLAIQNQTYTNWELIMCDDGSTDHTYEVARELAREDHRIKLLRNENNQGLNITLNKCLKASKGKYIARMDGDDDCLPYRFEKQIYFLKSHKEFAIVSSPMILFDDNGEWGITSSIEYPLATDIIKGTAICHAPCMLTREAIESVKGYTEDRRMIRVEDVNLWIKLYTAGYKCYNFSEPLYKMRDDQNATNRRKYKYRINEAYTRLKGCQDLNLGFKYKIYACKPLVVGLMPAKLRTILRKRVNKK